MMRKEQKKIFIGIVVIASISILIGIGNIVYSIFLK